MWTMEIFGKVFWMEQNLKEKIMDYDPTKKHSIYVTRMITEALQTHHQMFNESKRQKQYLPITIFFHKMEKNKCPLSKTPAILDTLLDAWRVLMVGISQRGIPSGGSWGWGSLMGNTKDEVFERYAKFPVSRPPSP
jgi:hypothetical protein